jgi:hypothetical protein
VDESAELVAALDLAGGSWTGRVGGIGRQERESAVWTLAVVMGGVGAEHVLEVAAAEDSVTSRGTRRGWCGRSAVSDRRGEE